MAYKNPENIHTIDKKPLKQNCGYKQSWDICFTSFKSNFNFFFFFWLKYCDQFRCFEHFQVIKHLRPKFKISPVSLRKQAIEM